MKRNTSLAPGDADCHLITSQFNLTVAARSPIRGKMRRKVSRARAAFWFEQMRQAVNAARDWGRCPTALPNKPALTSNQPMLNSSL